MANKIEVTWQRRYHDQVGGFPKVRLIYGTQGMLPPLISPCGANFVSFVVVRDCVHFKKIISRWIVCAVFLLAADSLAFIFFVCFSV